MYMRTFATWSEAKFSSYLFIMLAELFNYRFVINYFAAFLKLEIEIG